MYVHSGERVTTFFDWTENVYLFENRSVRWLIAYSTLHLVIDKAHTEEVGIKEY